MNDKTCFVISPIGERGSVDRRRADGVLNEIIRHALEPRGYKVERADHDKTPGIVTETIINKILDADLVVADLTGLNPNVMYELAVRHAAGKPVIQILEEGQALPFDIRSQNTIYFTSDLAGRPEAVRMIQAAEGLVLGSAALGNPIRRTIELRALQGGNDDQGTFLARVLADIQSELGRIRTEVSAKGQPASRLVQPPAHSLLSQYLLHDRRLDKRGIDVIKSEFGPDEVSIVGRWRKRHVSASYKCLGWQERWPENTEEVVNSLVSELLAKTRTQRTRKAKSHT